MDYEQGLKRVAAQYKSEGYQVFVRPGPDVLPPFARDFEVEICARREGGGVLASVKKDRPDFEADTNLPRYAEITNEQPGWRFDFFILEGENTRARELQGAQELSDEEISRLLDVADQLAQDGYVHPAVMTAWSGLEAAMRKRLRAAGEEIGWGSPPRAMLNDLYSSGILPSSEFRDLEGLYQLRNRITHGFVTTNLEPTVVSFLNRIGRRLLQEAQGEKQPA